jgi:1,4-dihydroxy-2-naphthoate octaprenyltransferase
MNPARAATPSRLQAYVLAARPKTLPAAVSPVLLGTLLAAADDAAHLLAAACALVGAVLIQVGTNYVNDAADFERGADTAARVGPVRAVAAGLLSARAMKAAAAVAFTLAFAAGVYLIIRGGWPILAIGLVSIAAGVAYTVGRYALAYVGLADLFVLVFFGPVAVGGTYYVQTLSLAPYVLVAGLGAGLLATAILVANNVRDVDEDRAAGKRTLVVRRGRGFGVSLYAACVLGAAIVPIVALWSVDGRYGALPASFLAAVVGGRLGRILERTSDPAVLNKVLARTAILLLAYCLVFGIGWWLT